MRAAPETAAQHATTSSGPSQRQRRLVPTAPSKPPTPPAVTTRPTWPGGRCRVFLAKKMMSLSAPRQRLSTSRNTSSVNSSRVAARYFRPSASSWRAARHPVADRSVRGTCGQRRRIPASEASETRKVSASMSIDTCSSPAAASRPAAPGPAIWPTWFADSSHEFAATSPRPGNTSRTAMASAVSENTVTAPAAKASDRTCQVATLGDPVSKKSAKKISARVMSPLIRTSHGSSRSASTPAGRPAAR